MEAETYPDPFREAMTHGLQRAMEVASLAVTAAQVYVYHQKAEARATDDSDERTRRALHAQVRAERDAARAGWSSAMDPRWLSNASLHDTARAWGAAMPYADPEAPWHEPTAATAMRKCEERLRSLHPFAMARYDRLRADGLGPAEAMREAAPLFALSPRARTWPFAPVLALSATTGTDTGQAADPPAQRSEPADWNDSQALESRGRGIVTAMQERARAAGREPLGHEELRTVLETVTNLPGDVIDTVSRPSPANGRARYGQSANASREAGATVAGTDPAGRSARPWDRDFPVPIHEVVATAAADPARTGASRPAVSRLAASQAAHRGGPGNA